MSRSRAFAFLLLGISLVLAVLILTDIWPFLRGPAPETSEWFWPYFLRPIQRWWPSIVLAVLFLIFGIWWVDRNDDRETIPLLLLALLGFSLQLSILFADRANIGAELVDRTLSKASNGYLATAGEIDNIGDALRRFPELMPALDNDHARTHPPGFIIAHWLTDQVLRRFPDLANILARPATLWRCTDLWILARPVSTAASLFLWSWLPPLLGALTAPVAYWLARLWSTRPAARLSALLVATLPALLVFSPTPDQIFAFMSVLSLWVLIVGLQKQRYSLLLLAGVITSVMTFFSIGNFAWMALLAAFTLLWLVWPAPEAINFLDWRNRRSGLFLILFVIGGVSIWVIYWLGWGVAPWRIIQVGLQQHYELVTSLRRYDWWFAYNLVDFFLFAGPAVVIGLLWQFATGLLSRRRGLEVEARLAILLTILLVGIHIAGSTRGEVGRLWLVFMPLAAVLAGGVWMKAARDRVVPRVILAAQLVLVLSIGLGWRSFYAVILPIERPEISPIREPEFPLDSVFFTPDGQTIRLLGFDAPKSIVTAGDNFEVTLYWQTDRPTLKPYTVFLHLVDKSGEVIAQQDNWPVSGLWPSTCWVGRDIIADPYVLEIPSHISSDGYMLIVGLYDAGTNNRLRTLKDTDIVDLLKVTPDLP